MTAPILTAKLVCCVDVVVGDEVHVEQAVGAVAGAQEVHLRQAQAPALEPQLELAALLGLGAAEVDDQVDVAARAGRGVLGAAEDVQALHAEAAGLELGGDALGHAQPPAPVVVAPAGPLGPGPVRRARRPRGPGRGQHRHRLVQLGVHEHAQHLPVGHGGARR